MTNQQLMDNGNQMMDETDQAIERSKKVSSTHLWNSHLFFSCYTIKEKLRGKNKLDKWLSVPYKRYCVSYGYYKSSWWL